MSSSVLSKRCETCGNVFVKAKCYNRTQWAKRRYCCRQCAPTRFTKGANHGFKHGGVGTRLYRIWACMRQRCYCKSTPGYAKCGALGARICDEWHDFSVFREWSLSHGYADDLTIDRYPNQVGHYEPSNCRWATALQQAHNTRGWKTRVSRFKGVTRIPGARKKKWRAQISANGTMRHLGCYPTEESAARAYDKAAKELYGDTFFNFPEEVNEPVNV